MEDAELRKAMAVLESYNQQLEALDRQVRILQVSLEETKRARDSLKALNEAKEGDEVLLPIGASSFIPAKVTGKKTAVVGVGNRVSVEKSMDDAIAYMEANAQEIGDALKQASAALVEIEGMTQNLGLAIQNEYANRQNNQ